MDVIIFYPPVNWYTMCIIKLQRCVFITFTSYLLDSNPVARSIVLRLLFVLLNIQHGNVILCLTSFILFPVYLSDPAPFSNMYDLIKFMSLRSYVLVIYFHDHKAIIICKLKSNALCDRNSQNCKNKIFSVPAVAFGEILNTSVFQNFHSTLNEWPCVVSLNAVESQPNIISFTS